MSESPRTINKVSAGIALRGALIIMTGVTIGTKFEECQQIARQLIEEFKQALNENEPKPTNVESRLHALFISVQENNNPELLMSCKMETMLVREKLMILQTCIETESPDKYRLDCYSKIKELNELCEYILRIIRQKEKKYENPSNLPQLQPHQRYRQPPSQEHNRFIPPTSFPSRRQRRASRAQR